MNLSFFNLTKSKQAKIIQAALKEFAKNGYEKASTNQIVKEAGIGKGMLFYYFNSKQELYYFLVDYCLDITFDKFLNRVDMNETDFIERLKQISQVKMEYHLKYPYVLTFLGNFFLQNDEKDIPENLSERYLKMVKQSEEKLFNKIDLSLFRNDVNEEMSLKLIRWSIEGYQNKMMDYFKTQNLTTVNFDPYWNEFYEYLDVLKTVFYRQEER